MKAASKNTRPKRIRNSLVRLLYFAAWFASVSICAALLLVINNALVWAFIETYSDRITESIRNEKAMQAILLCVPMLMIFAQFWIYDFIVDLLRRRRRR